MSRLQTIRAGIAFSAALGLTLASAVSGAQAAGAPQAARPPAAAAPAPTLFDQHVRQGAVTTCANLYGALGRVLVADSTYSARSRWNTAAPNAHAMDSIVTMKGAAKDPGQATAGVVLASPVGPAACEGAAVKVTPTSDSCPAVEAELARAKGRRSVVGDLAVMTLPNGAEVTLIPFRNACVAVSTIRGAG